MNSYPQFITEVDGLDIHFIHARSPHEDALPLIVTHGWPGSIVEQLKIHRTAHEPDRPRWCGVGTRSTSRSRSMPGDGDSVRADHQRLRARYRIGRAWVGADATPRRTSPRFVAERRLGRSGSSIRWASTPPPN